MFNHIPPSGLSLKEDEADCTGVKRQLSVDFTDLSFEVAVRE